MKEAAPEVCQVSSGSPLHEGPTNRRRCRTECGVCGRVMPAQEPDKHICFFFYE